jgi:3-oxoadipate enol-lactonase
MFKPTVEGIAILYYTDSGRGEPLVLLHSGGMSGEEWKSQIPLFSRYFRVIVPDQLGHGRSQMVAEHLLVADMSHAILELLDTLNLKKVNLLGSSLGGAVALWLTLHYPERISKLVLYRISYCKDSKSYDSIKNIAHSSYWQNAGMLRWLSEIHYPQGGPHAWQVVISRVLEALDPRTPGHEYQLEIMKSILQPTLLVVGDRDPLVPLERILDMFHTIPNCGLWVMPYTGHVTATVTWRATSFAQEVTKFLNSKASA